MKKVLLILLLSVVLLTGCGKEKTTNELLDMMESKTNEFLNGTVTYEETINYFGKVHDKYCKEKNSDKACKLMKSLIEEYEEQKEISGDVSKDSLINEKRMKKALEEIKEIRDK